MLLQFKKQDKQQVRWKFKKEFKFTPVRSILKNTLFLILKEMIALDLIVPSEFAHIIYKLRLINNLKLCAVEISHASLSESVREG